MLGPEGLQSDVRNAEYNFVGQSKPKDESQPTTQHIARGIPAPSPGGSVQHLQRFLVVEQL